MTCFARSTCNGSVSSGAEINETSAASTPTAARIVMGHGVKLKCEVCEMSRGWVWTDTHGVGQCVTCGAPYRMYHYDDDHRRVDRPPLLCIKPEHIELARRYWRVTGAKMPSGHSLTGRDVASPQEIEQFMDWWNAQTCRHNERISTRSGHVSKRSP